ncbi:hypothetical protein [Natronobacterium texcoconense]|nr:hypothetical protein [Natronobacterium texcoconense]
MNTDSRVRTLALAILEALDRFGTLSGRVLHARVEETIPEIHPSEYAEALQRVRTLELVEEIDAGYAWLYSLTNTGVVVLEKHRSDNDLGLC